MTLQQKMLAKQSKKGFTLVELVVVIAILAILAAIAIPAVIGIINSASQSAGASDAATLDNAAKSVYASVKSGALNNDDSKNNDGSDIDWAAAKGASNKARQGAADAITIAQVQKYQGISLEYDDLYYATSDHDDVHITKGTIQFWDHNGTQPASCDQQLSAGTTLKDLYK